MAAVNVAVHASRWSIEAIHDELLPRLLRATAAEIEADLRDAAPPAPAPARAVPVAAAPPAEAPTDDGDRETDFVQSLQRGLAVIRAFDAEHPALTLSDVAKATGLARAAARRFVLTLVELGYMRVDGRLFRLSPRVLELGPAVPVDADAARDRAARTCATSSGTCRSPRPSRSLDGNDIVYVAHVVGAADPVRVGVRRLARPGVRDVARPCAARGPDRRGLAPILDGEQLARLTDATIVDPNALLDELQEIRAQGYALVDQELEEGLRALAVPMRDEHGEVMAAVNVAVHASRWTVEGILGELLPRLLETAAAIEIDVRAVGAPTAESLALA